MRDRTLRSRAESISKTGGIALPLDGLTLGFVCRELSERLVGGRVDRVQQPERDELHLLIRSQGENHRLLLCASAHHARIHLTGEGKPNPMEPPMFCMLMRKHLQGGRVAAVRRVAGDRIAEIAVDALDELGEVRRRTLIIEVMGRHSNIVLRDADGRIIDAIRHVGADMSRVRQIQPGLPYAYPPSQGKLDPDEATREQLAEALAQGSSRLHKALLESIAGLSPQAARELACRLAGDEEAVVSPGGAAGLAERLHALLGTLPALTPPVLLLDGDGQPVDVYPFAQHRHPDALQRPVPEGMSAALDAFFRARDRHDRVSQRTASLLRTLKTHIERCEKKLALQQEALEGGARMEEWRICGELISANLHVLEKGMTQTTLANFYDPENAQLTIALDAQYTPIQNAQRYFKRYQKARVAQRMAADQIQKSQAELEWLDTQLDDLRKCTDDAEIGEIRTLLTEGGYLRASHHRGAARKAKPSQPFHYLSSDGYDIFVGKNSVQNDRLTTQARGDDTWLHAKDMPGSHVVIASEEVVPDSTLREAVLLAAYYSKGSASSRVPVDYTLRRYVKKPGGTPVGYFTYTQQETMWVVPDETAVKRLTLVNGA